MSLLRPAEWTPRGIDELEERAWIAIRETRRSVCVTAGAGAGKTELLAQKAAYLLQTGICAAPARILAISFKRDAAATLAARVRMRTSEEQGRRFISLTFDAWTKRLIDQFRLALPAPYVPPFEYEIVDATRDSLRAFLDRVGSGLNADQFQQLVANTRLPIEEQGLPVDIAATLVEYWSEQYGRYEQTLLTFAMINRLAEHLIRTNAAIRQALRATYHFVFLDEFQDTTKAQFQLVRTAFDIRHTSLTTVGDDKQKIMGWAGALPNSFELLANLYQAREVSLLCNWRSHEDLVAIQHVVAQRIDPKVEKVRARKSRMVDGDISAIWSFADREAEVAHLADWVADEVVRRGLAPHDIAILVRSKPGEVEDELGPAFASRGIALRNVARTVGKIAIQDLLAEEMTALLLPLLRLGSCRRDPKAWCSAMHELRALEAAQEGDDATAERIVRKAETLTKALRRYMVDTPPGLGRGQEVLEMLIGLLGEAAIRRSSPVYRRTPDFVRVRTGIELLLEESLECSANWSDALDRFEGVDQVPLMTIHKSKGMEFHTVVFFGLDSQSWWSLTPAKPEELKSLFVALTRAEQRAFFTCCHERGRSIHWIEDLLGNAVPRIPGGPQFPR